ncbi:Endonuclease V, partial [Durusdinium trenchii]
GTGWRVQALMQWSTAYGIPSAIGVGLENSDWVSIVQDLSVMFYWWLPDATFAHLQPSKVIFP